MSISDNPLYERVLGCLAGGAIGDAMGGATEMMHYATIESVFGKVTDLVPHGDTPETARFNPSEPAGRYTDDTRLRNVLCEAIIASEGRLSPDELGWAWKDLMEGWFFTPVANSYYKISCGLSRPRDAGRGNMASNSTAMCIAPVGIMNAADPWQAAQDAYAVAGLVHEGYARDAAAAVAAAVAEALGEAATVKSVAEAATSYLDRDVLMRDLIERAISLAMQSRGYEHFREAFYEKMLFPWPQSDIVSGQRALEGFYDTADPREAVPAAIGLFVLAEGDPNEAIVGAANFGRDSDTIGAMVGAIAGAYGGVGRLRPEWVQLVDEANDCVQADLARRMLAVLEGAVRRRASVVGELCERMGLTDVAVRSRPPSA